MKILASDYDNTLYVQNEEIYKKNIQYVKEFRDKGNLFIVITGRSYQGIKDELTENNILYDYLICNDGAKIFNKNDEVLKTEELDIEKINKCKKILDEEQLENYIEDGFKKLETPKNCIKVVGIYDNKQHAKKVLDKIKKEVDVYAYLSTRYINIIASHVNKCYGLENLLKIENLSAENLTVIGDEINDYEMLKKFNGVTMKNHGPELDELNLKEYETLYEYIEELL